MTEERANHENSLARIARYLKEIASYNRRCDLVQLLADEERRRAYELSDGETTSEEIAKHSAISKTARTIRRWWSEWREVGLIEYSADYPRHRYSTFVLDLDREE